MTRAARVESSDERKAEPVTAPGGDEMDREPVILKPPAILANLTFGGAVLVIGEDGMICNPFGMISFKKCVTRRARARRVARGVARWSAGRSQRSRAPRSLERRAHTDDVREESDSRALSRSGVSSLCSAQNR